MSTPQRGIALDLTHYHFRRELGDIAVYGTWIGADLDDTEPCLVLVAPHRVGHTRSKPACIALSSAYKYDDPRYLLHAARQFNQGLGFEDTMQRVHRVADLIHSHLLDLIKMPERAPRGSVVAGVARLTDRDTGRSTEIEIKESL